jgi:hypothetical protein
VRLTGSGRGAGCLDCKYTVSNHTPLKRSPRMYDLNRSDEPRSITLNLDHVAPTDVRAEFGATLHALTPSVLVTPALLGLNILMFLVMIDNGVHPLHPTTDSLLQWGADYGPKTVGDGQ